MATSTGRATSTGGRTAVPGPYWAWLGGTGLSLLGVQAMAFAMTWVVAGQGGRFAALVLTAITLPRVLLLLVGGAVADRIGAWRVMIVSDAAMVVVTVTLAVAAWSAADPRLPLLLTALAIGIVDAFYLPSSGSMPRRLVPPAALARAMSARQLAGQLAVFAGPPLGSLILAAAGLTGVALVNAASFLVVLSVLLLLRPRAAGSADLTAGRSSDQGGGLSPDPGVGRAADPREGRTAEPVQSVWRAALDGLRIAASESALRPALLVTAVAAGFLLPVSSLLVPLLARERAWSAQATGAVVAAVALGTAVVAVTVLVRGALARPGVAAAAGLLVAAAGVAALAVGWSPLRAAVAGAAIGVGSGIFATHVGPLILAATPVTHLARVQSVLVLVQSLPLLVTTNALGWLADALHAPVVLCGCAGVLAAAGLAALTAPALRKQST